MADSCIPALRLTRAAHVASPCFTTFTDCSPNIVAPQNLSKLIREVKVLKTNEEVSQKLYLISHEIEDSGDARTMRRCQVRLLARRLGFAN